MIASMATSAGTERAHPVNALSALLNRQRDGFLHDGPPSLEQRRADLIKLRLAIKDSADRIADVISADFGNRSRHESLLGEVFATRAAIRHSLRHLARWMRPKRVPVRIELQRGRARILFQPLGVVGIISPWNYPFQLAIIPLAAALAAGNRVMLKPSELAPRTAEFIAEFLARLFPPEQVSTVLGDHTVGAALSGLPLDHLLYTGSTAVGRLVMQAAAENLTPVTLELGGKSPCIIGEDAALPAAVESILYGKLVNAGQSCIAPDYVLVPTAMRENFIRLAGQAVRKMYPNLKSNADYTSQRASLSPDHAIRRGSKSRRRACSRARLDERTARARRAQGAADARRRAQRRTRFNARRDLRPSAPGKDLFLDQ
jgi:coniferyl-aldehyde dehydrogenase